MSKPHVTISLEAWKLAKAGAKKQKITLKDFVSAAIKKASKVK